MDYLELVIYFEVAEPKVNLLVVDYLIEMWNEHGEN